VLDRLDHCLAATNSSSPIAFNGIFDGDWNQDRWIKVDTLKNDAVIRLGRQHPQRGILPKHQTFALYHNLASERSLTDGLDTGLGCGGRLIGHR
jgi:hypothetical protein